MHSIADSSVNFTILQRFAFLAVWPSWPASGHSNANGMWSLLRCEHRPSYLTGWLKLIMKYCETSPFKNNKLNWTFINKVFSLMVIYFYVWNSGCFFLCTTILIAYTYPMGTQLPQTIVSTAPATFLYRFDHLSQWETSMQDQWPITGKDSNHLVSYHPDFNSRVYHVWLTR